MQMSAVWHAGPDLDPESDDHGFASNRRASCANCFVCFEWSEKSLSDPAAGLGILPMSWLMASLVVLFAIAVRIPGSSSRIH